MQDRKVRLVRLVRWRGPSQGLPLSPLFIEDLHVIPSEGETSKQVILKLF